MRGSKYVLLSLLAVLAYTALCALSTPLLTDLLSNISSSSFYCNNGVQYINELSQGSFNSSPSASINTYKNNQNCTWVITAQESEQLIYVEWPSFETECYFGTIKLIGAPFHNIYLFKIISSALTEKILWRNSFSRYRGIGSQSMATRSHGLCLRDQQSLVTLCPTRVTTQRASKPTSKLLVTMKFHAYNIIIYILYQIVATITALVMENV
jgi:hypothetical protein